jgi:hypothetical protein
MSAVAPLPPKLITLNVAGTRITTFRETLIRGSPYFAALLSGKWGDKTGSLEEEEVTPDTCEFFLDMDPDLFQMLLNRMRYPEMSLKQNGNTPGLREAADFLGMELATETEKKQPDCVNMTGTELCLRMLERLKVGDYVQVYFCWTNEWVPCKCTAVLPFTFLNLYTDKILHCALENTWDMKTPDGYIKPIDDKSRIEILSREVVRKRPQ